MKYTLEQARLLSDLTQVEMSEIMNMSEKTYIQYEKYRRVFRMDQGYNFANNVTVPFDSIIFFAGQVQKSCSAKRAISN